MITGISTGGRVRTGASYNFYRESVAMPAMVNQAAANWRSSSFGFASQVRLI